MRLIEKLYLVRYGTEEQKAKLNAKVIERLGKRFRPNYIEREFECLKQKYTALKSAASTPAVPPPTTGLSNLVAASVTPSKPIPTPAKPTNITSVPDPFKFE